MGLIIATFAELKTLLEEVRILLASFSENAGNTGIPDISAFLII